MRTVYFGNFHSLVNHGIIFWVNTSSMHKVFLTQKQVLKSMLGIGSRSCCGKWFKELELLPIPSLYIYSLMLFVVDNMHDFQSNLLFMGLIQDIRINYTYLQLRLSAVERGTAYSAVKIFGTLPHRNSRLKNDEIIFKFAVRKYLLTHVF